MAQQVPLADLRALVGHRQPPSRWFEMGQDRINAHADTTEDWQYIHLDQARAVQTPFGTTVAHGFLTLSMLSAMFYDALPEPADAQMSVNYGFNRLRFIAPVPSGARLRGHFTLSEILERKPGEVMLTHQVEIEIEGQDKPALFAEWLNLYVFAPKEA